jgi:hypothetical protein
MKIPELGDLIVTRNGKRWICATSETIREKVGVDPDINYPNYPIKAHSVDCDSFMMWKGDETGSYSIESVIPAKNVRHQTPQKPRKHSELIKAWADGADVEWYDPGTKKWTPISGPPWREDAEYRIKTTTEFVCHINSDGEIISFDSGNLSLTFNNLGELISAEVIKK